MSGSDTDCLLCSMEQADDGRVVFRDSLWSAEVVPGYEVPGWFILRTRRHAEYFGGLDDEELASFAFRVRDLIAAVNGVTGAPATYMMMFGENYSHFHVLVAARGADVAENRRTGDILKLRLEAADPKSAIALVPQIRHAYTSIVENQSSESNSLSRG